MVASEPRRRLLGLHVGGRHLLVDARQKGQDAPAGGDEDRKCRREASAGERSSRAREHQTPIRTTNPFESAFTTVRDRAMLTRVAMNRQDIVAMVLKLSIEVQKRWRYNNSYPQIVNLCEFFLCNDLRLGATRELGQIPCRAVDRLMPSYSAIGISFGEYTRRWRRLRPLPMIARSLMVIESPLPNREEQHDRQG